MTQSTCPVIFLAFANEREEGARYLRNLPKELTLLRQALEKAETAGLCELVIQPNARIEDIIDTFQKQRYQGRIAVFHYGGHADGFQLLLESLEGKTVVARGEGLVSFLGHQDSLQLVFLNGCSTQQQSEELVAAGVPAVVGTSQSIADDTATQLAARFYKGLGEGLSLDHAWREAVDEQKMTGESRNFRGILLQEEDGGGQFPWNLYIREGAEIVRRWNLPEAADNPLFGLPDLPPMDLPEEPYRFLDRYRREHAPIFFGRSYYIRELFERTTDPKSAPLILLYGQSGAGKSSMLEAGLLPRLEPVAEVVSLRRDPEHGLKAQLLEALAPAAADADKAATRGNQLWEDIQHLEKFALGSAWEIRPDLQGLIDRLKRRLEAVSGANDRLSPRDAWLRLEARHQKPLVIILDQLEEAITMPRENQPEELPELLTLVREIFDDPQSRPQGKLILSYRKGYHPEILAACKEFRLPREELFLEPLRRKDIIEVVTGLTSRPQLERTYRLAVEDNLPAIIAEDLLADKESAVAPILQILLTKLWRLNEGDANRQFTVDNYHLLLREGILLDDFFNQQLEHLRAWNAEVENSGLAHDILAFHTTQWQTAGACSLEDLRKRYEHQQDILEPVLKHFQQLFLLTGAARHQTRLAHDTLAPLVQRALKDSDRPGQRALRILENKSRAFEANPDTYLDVDDLQLVEEGKNGMRLWKKKEEELINQSRLRRDQLLAERRRNRRFKRAAVTALAAFAVVVTILGLRAYRAAQANALVSLALEEEKIDATAALRIAAAAADKTPANPAIRQVLARLYGANEFYQQSAVADAPLSALAVAPSDSAIAAIGQDGRLYLWNADGTLRDTFPAHDGAGLAVAFSPDGQYLLTGGEDDVAKLWDRQGALLQTFTGHDGAVQAVAFSPDGALILTGSRDQTAILWNREGNILQTLSDHEGAVYDLMFSPDGALILTGSEDGTALLYTIEGRRLRQFAGHQDRVLSVDLAPDGAHLLTGSRDRTAILWDTAGYQLARFAGHEGRVNKARFAADGQSVFTAGDDRRIIQWALSGERRRTYQGHRSYVNDLALAPGGRLLVSAGEDQTLKFWPVSGKVFREFRHSGEGIGAAALSPDGRLTATAGYRVYADPLDEEFDMEDKSQVIRLWDRDGNLLQTFTGHEDGILSLAFSPDNAWLLSGSKDGTARIWAVNPNEPEGREVLQLTPHTGEVSAVAFSPLNSQFLTAGADSTARLWDREGNEIAVFRGHGDWVLAAAFSPDGRHLLTGSYDQTARWWSVDQPEMPPLVLNGHTAAVVAVAAAPDGRSVLTGSEDNTARLWDLKGNLLLDQQQYGQNLSGMGAVRCVAFAPDGKALALGGSDGTTRIMDPAGNLLQILRDHEKGVTSVAFSSDNRFVLTAGDDGVANLDYQVAEFLRTGRIAPLNFDPNRLLR